MKDSCNALAGACQKTTFISQHFKATEVVSRRVASATNLKSHQQYNKRLIRQLRNHAGPLAFELLDMVAEAGTGDPPKSLRQAPRELLSRSCGKEALAMLSISGAENLSNQLSPLFTMHSRKSLLELTYTVTI